MSELHAVIFAGGAGQRLWPLSRRNSPKQFTPLVGERSSIRLAFERLAELTSPTRLYVATNRDYLGILRQQRPEIPEKNFFLEPARRDVAAAVALAFFSLERDGVRGPVAFQWSDHYVRRGQHLTELYAAAAELLREDPHHIVIVGQPPHSPNDNLGWIELGEQRGTLAGSPVFSFDRWQYRPPVSRCKEMLASGRYAWNTGHFVTSIEFMTSSFRSLAPDLTRSIEKIVKRRGTPQEQSALEALYPELPKLHFDDAFLMRVPRERALLVNAELEWCDPGNLSSLKEVLESAPDANVLRGSVVELQTSDSFIYNDASKPVVVMGLSHVIVVEMNDVTLVINRDSVRDLGLLLAELDRRGLSALL
jgi:mannose-1-phosphate guanylyltransferase